MGAFGESCSGGDGRIELVRLLETIRIGLRLAVTDDG